MPRTKLPIAKGFNRDESLTVAAIDCVNLFPHILQGKTVDDGVLFGVAGIEQVADTAVNAFNRGGSAMAGIPYFVCGTKLYNVTYVTDIYGVRTYTANDVSGAETINGTARVHFSNNGVQLVIVAPDYANQFNAWVYTVAGGLVQITDADFDGPVAGVDFSYGYFLFPKINSNTWFHSDLRDGLAYVATDFTVAESDPDNIVVIKPLNGLVYVFGTSTMEPYQNIQGAGFQFQTIPSAIQQKGCTAPHSIVELNGNLMWIGAGVNEQPAIYASSGGLPEKLSSAAIDNLIYQGGITQLQNAYAIKWAERGHSFVSITVPSVCTIVYDAVTGLWHERKSVDRFYQPQPWRVTSMVDAYSVRLVGDELSGVIGLMSEDIFYEYDAEIRSYFTTEAVDNTGRPFSIAQVQLQMETGTNPVTGQGSAPVVRMSVSKDGGITYSPEISREMGSTGDYYSAISWPALGRYARSACFRFDISEPIKKVFARLEVEIGA
jgi:hypothetical protein